jgi:hypothetical protein
MKRLISVLILLGAVTFVVAISQKIIHWPNLLGLIPASYLKFSAISLLLAIALSARELTLKEK